MSDLISRQAAKKIIYEEFEGWPTDKEIAQRKRLTEQLDELPSVEPERKPGKWIDGKCNRCGTHAPFWAMASTYYCSDYCPKCGAKMEVNE